MIPEPWDEDAEPGQPDWSQADHGHLQKDALLLPPDVMSEAALELRKRVNQNYKADMVRLEQECDAYAPKVRAVVMGHDKGGEPQPLDRDICLFLLTKIVEYIEKFPDEASKSEEKTIYKRRVWDDMFAKYPDTDPLHREFASQLAISAYWDVCGCDTSTHLRSDFLSNGRA